MVEGIGTLLQLLANPKVADPHGAYMQGKRNAANDKALLAKQAIAQQQVGINQQNATTGSINAATAQGTSTAEMEAAKVEANQKTVAGLISQAASVQGTERANILSIAGDFAVKNNMQGGAEVIKHIAKATPANQDIIMAKGIKSYQEREALKYIKDPSLEGSGSAMPKLGQGSTSVGPDGTQYMNQIVVDPDGKERLIQMPIPGTLANKQGQTPVEASNLDIKTAGGVAEAVNAANLIGLPPIAKEKAMEEATASLATTSFEQAQGLRSAIRQLNLGVKSIDEGARTGWLAQKFPTMASATLSLKNVQAKLGLNVIQNTTFGSLSQAELDFALATSLPMDKQPAELRKWILDSMAAKRKYADILDNAGTYLSQPGNSIAGLRKLQAEERAKQKDTTPRNTAPQAAMDFLKSNPTQIDNFVKQFGYTPEGY